MTSYSNINDAFSVKEYDELDRMARNINNKIQDNHNYSNYRSDCEINGNNNSVQSIDQSDEFKFYSAQGNIENNSSHSKNSFDFGTTEQSSTGTHNSNAESASVTDSCYKKKYKKYVDKIHDIVKKSHNDDHSYSDNSNSYDDIINHIKSCYKCKKSMKNKVHNKYEKHNSSDFEDIVTLDKRNINNVIESSQNIDSDISSSYNDLNMYNIIVALLIGIGIIILLDLIYRSSAFGK